MKIKLLSIWNLCLTKLFWIYNPYFQSIHSTPIYVWKELQKDNPDFSIMLKSNLKRRELKSDSIGLGFDYYIHLLDEFFKEFGISKTFDESMSLRKEITALNLKFNITSDRFILNIIELKKEQLKKLEDIDDDKSRNTNFKDEMSKVIDSFNVIVDIKELTIYQYYLQRLRLEKNG